MPADTSQLRQLAVDLRGLGPAAVKKSRIAIQKTCADTKRDAQAHAPVDTGNLRSSIGYATKATKGGASGEVGPTAAYGLYVEAGTSRMRPQPYMRPSFDRHAPLLERILDSLKVGILE